MTIELGKYVALHYSLSGIEEGQEPEHIENTTPEKPFSFLYGVGMLLPAFEKNIAGLQVGDKFDFTLTPGDAYGEYDENRVLVLDKKMFCDPDGNFLSQYVMVGGMVPLQNQAGEIIQATVSEITDDHVTCDANHPLAGMTLHFEGSVAEVREATEEDKKQYMAATCGDGEASCECGCGHDHCDSCEGGCGENGGCGHCH